MSLVELGFLPGGTVVCVDGFWGVVLKRSTFVEGVDFWDVEPPTRRIVPLDELVEVATPSDALATIPRVGDSPCPDSVAGRVAETAQEAA